MPNPVTQAPPQFTNAFSDPNLVGSGNIIHYGDGTDLVSGSSTEGGGGTTNTVQSAKADVVNAIKPLTSGTADLSGLSVDSIVQGAKRNRKTSQQRSL